MWGPPLYDHQVSGSLINFLALHVRDEKTLFHTNSPIQYVRLYSIILCFIYKNIYLMQLERKSFGICTPCLEGWLAL